jgi:hypothetical protein
MSIKTEHVDVNMKFKLKKDMVENEEICTRCGGLGIVSRDSPYGIRKEGESINFNNPFPFNKQSFTFCPDCYNGVRKRCKHCDCLVPKSYTECQCNKSKEERGVASWQLDLKRWQKSKKNTYDEALKNFEKLYVDNSDSFVDSDELIEHLHDYMEEHDLKIEDVLDWHIYTTNIFNISFDSHSIVEDACDELHEESYERISDSKFKELQNYLDKWASEVKNETTTYYPNWNIGILLSEEDLK